MTTSAVVCLACAGMILVVALIGHVRDAKRERAASAALRREAAREEVARARTTPPPDPFEPVLQQIDAAGKYFLERGWRPAVLQVNADVKRELDYRACSRQIIFSTGLAHGRECYDVFYDGYGHWRVRFVPPWIQTEPVRFYRHGEPGVAQYLRVEIPG